MAIYTGIADANGDFAVPFSSSYTSGQKVTVTAEKDNATKSIELFAPSEVTGGGFLQFSGSLDSFPQNIGTLTLKVNGKISNYAMQAANQQYNIFRWATGLVLDGLITTIGNYAFSNWSAMVSLQLPETVTSIGSQAFSFCEGLESITLPASLLNLKASAFYTLTTTKLKSLVIKGSDGVLSIEAAAFATQALLSIVCYRITPPTIPSGFFSDLNSNCIIKVPAASVEAYKTNPNWSAVAARIQAI